MSTPTRYQRLTPAERRDQILDAANTLFAERGYEDVLVEDISRAAGVTRGLVHHYFGGRKDVYLALLERLGAVREEQLRAPVGRSARDRVADTVSRWLDWTGSNRTIYLGTIAPGEDIIDPDVRRVDAELRSRAVAQVAAFHSDIADGLAAPALRAGVLDRPEQGRHTSLATRRVHPRDDSGPTRFHARTRSAHVRSAQAARRTQGVAKHDQWIYPAARDPSSSRLTEQRQRHRCRRTGLHIALTGSPTRGRASAN